ncbi:MAG: hypothetical protein P0119_00440 [Nitrospira sp.]|nr:hypothetical protein [Nitrospira sp.]
MDNFFTPEQITNLEQVGCKFSPGGSHSSRTLMLPELQCLLDAVPPGSPIDGYHSAILTTNVLGKGTQSTKQKSFRHLRELYGLSEAVPIFAVLRRLYLADPQGLPLLALLCAWSRDPLLRATTPAISSVPEGMEVSAEALANAIAEVFPGQYSELNQNKIARNAASSWTQSGHLVGRAHKVRRRVQPTVSTVTMALWLGEVAGIHGTASFTNPWCRLLDLSADQARSRAMEAHRHGLLTMRAVGEIVELTFPGLPAIEHVSS